MAAHDHLAVKRKAARRDVARTCGVSGAQREAIDIRAIEWRHIDRRGDVVRKHTAQCFGQADGLVRQRRQIDVSVKACARLLGRDHFEELFLARGAADRGDEIALDRFWFETCRHGQGLIMTSVCAG